MTGKITTIEDQQIKLSRSAQNAMRELRAKLAQLDELKERIDALKGRIRPELELVLQLGGKAQGMVGGVPVCELKSAIRQNVNMSLLRKRAPEIVAECTVENEVKTFKIMGEK